jgi:TP901 family phage tail tape measure protein
VINVIKQAASEVTQLNTDITDLAKVSEQSVKQIYSDFSSYADIAKEMGGTISDTISATTAWAKNGYSIPDSKELARVSLLYKNVGDDITIDEANESLVSTLQGYKLAADDAEHIVDVFNEVSNNEAISSAGIGEALQRSAASFNAANTSLEQSVALVTATNSVLQDPEKVGNMWKTVSARIRGRLCPSIAKAVVYARVEISIA